MASKEIVEKLIELFSECTRVDINEIVRKSYWGNINFEDIIPDLQELYRTCDDLRKLPIEKLHHEAAISILNRGEPVKTSLSQIRDFTIEQARPIAERDRLVSILRENLDRFYIVVRLYIPYLEFHGEKIEESIRDLAKLVEKEKDILDSIHKMAEEKKQEVDDIVTIAREASASVGVAEFTVDFEAEADRLRKLANIWLLASVFLSLFTVVVGILFIVLQDSTDNLFDLAQYIATKVIVLGVLATAAMWCGNIYKATMHQMQTNTFKANALKTFQAFVNATKDPAMKDAVLMEATRAIFDQGTTGYISGESAKTGESTRILEIIKSAAKPDN